MLFEDKYLVTATAGDAGKRKFGKVFFGIEKATGNKVVVKSLSKTSENSMLQERLKSESDFTFKSSQLPEVLDFIETESELFLVLDFREGIPLMEFVKQIKQKEKPAFILEFLKKLQPVFNELKGKQILHLDIKPGNIIINGSADNFEISLIDFGMAVRINEIPERTTLFPLGYAAPELILNRLHLADQRSDIFSLGIVCWQVFTGKMPLLHPNPSVITNLQITHPLPENDLIPAAYFPVLKKMSNKHVFLKPPNHYAKEEMDVLLHEGISGRYTTIEEIIRDWLSAQQRKKDGSGFSKDPF